MQHLTHRILPALLLALLAPACDDSRADYDNVEVSRETAVASAPAVRARGVTGYAITRDAGRVHVEYRGADEPGGLTVDTLASGVVHLELDWRGRSVEFEVDTDRQPAPLTIRVGDRSAVVHPDRAAEPSAQALFAEVQGEWEVARATFVELDLVPDLFDKVEAQLGDGLLFTEGLAISPRPAADDGCPNVCYQNGCAWFWDQYCHTTPRPGGLCQVGYCGCGDC